MKLSHWVHSPKVSMATTRETKSIPVASWKVYWCETFILVPATLSVWPWMICSSWTVNFCRGEMIVTSLVVGLPFFQQVIMSYRSAGWELMTPRIKYGPCFLGNIKRGISEGVMAMDAVTIISPKTHVMINETVNSWAADCTHRPFLQHLYSKPVLQAMMKLLVIEVYPESRWAYKASDWHDGWQRRQSKL